MTKAYDAVIVGAGPAGAMAAKTAAENGLKVALLERKREISQIRRSCAMMWLAFNEPYFGEFFGYNRRNNRLCFPTNGFSINYSGPSKNLYAIHIYSPDDNLICFGDCKAGKMRGDSGRIAMVHDKATLLRDLLSEAETLGADIYPGVNVTDIKKLSNGVQVTGSGQTFNSTFVIAADGINSRLAALSGFNQKRSYYGMMIGSSYRMTDVGFFDPDAFTMLFYGHPTPAVFALSPRAAGDGFYLICLTFDPRIEHAPLYDHLTKESPFAHAFKNAKVLERASVVENLWEPIYEPYRDNVLFIGDTSWAQEAENTGALMCGWKAANAVTRALLEKKISKEGVSSYLAWWKSSYCDDYNYIEYLKNYLMCNVFTSEDINYMFSLIQETMPATLDAYKLNRLMGEQLMKVLSRISQEKPNLVPKIQKFATAPLEELFSEMINAGYPNRQEM
jgi:digeranylgeranylglycerophospholipid reductase